MKTKKLQQFLFCMSTVGFLSACGVVSFSVENGGGTVGATVDGAIISPGSPVANDKEIVFKAIPENNYTVCYWTLNDSIVNQGALEYRIKMKDNKTLNVTVAFAKADSGYPKSSYKISDDGATLFDWPGKETVVDMNNDCNLAKVKVVSSSEHRAGVKKLILGNRVTTLKPFNTWCFSLQELTISKNVSKMEGAIRSYDLKKIILSDQNNHYLLVDGVLFSKDKKTLVLFPAKRTGKYVVPEGVTHIAPSAFHGSDLSEVILPGTLIEIGDRAFERAEDLKKIDIPNSVQSIGEFAFVYALGLEEIMIGSGVSKTGKGFIADTYSLKKIRVADNNPFFTVLNGVLFSKDMKKLIACPKANNSNKQYSIPHGVEEIDYGAFSAVKGITEVSIPNTVRIIRQAAFLFCDVEELTIPDSVTDIEGELLRYAGRVKKVTFGRNVKRIGSGTFVDCSSLREIVSLNPVPPKAESFTYGQDMSKITLRVPRGSKQAYKAAPGWNRFDQIIEM